MPEISEAEVEAAARIIDPAAFINYAAAVKLNKRGPCATHNMVMLGEAIVNARSVARRALEAAASVRQEGDR